MELTFTSILIRVSVMYVFALALIRLTGKQSVSELSTMDFVVITILGDPFDSVIYSEVTLAQGLVSFTTIALLHLLVRILASRSDSFFRLVSSPPRTMIQNGTYVKRALQAERMRMDSVESQMRLKGEDQLAELKEAWLEENGKLSVIRNTPSRPAQKQDRKLLRQAD
jgi:uncharacterized membrane protein YcaP (DUF421 family)